MNVNWPSRSLLLTGELESEDLGARVDRFMTQFGADIHVIDIPDGHHGFDCAGRTDESSQLVMAAADFVVAELSGQDTHARYGVPQKDSSPHPEA